VALPIAYIVRNAVRRVALLPFLYPPTPSAGRRPLIKVFGTADLVTPSYRTTSLATGALHIEERAPPRKSEKALYGLSAGENLTAAL
jgi:hypothetical protein